MQCDYFDAGACRSCELMGQAYAHQLADKQAAVASVLSGPIPSQVWLDPIASRESGFRNKAKLAVGGRKGAPTLGILDPGGHGVDLRHCGLYEPGLHRAVVSLADVLAESGLTPYDVSHRQGELKHVLVTHSPDGELMARFVLRSPGQRRRVTELIERWQHQLGDARLRVASVNLQPEHKAVLEGEVEDVLTGYGSLPMRVAGLTLHLSPGAFFQTNTAVAARLYQQVGHWVEQVAPATVWDLYCGVGGFALHSAAADRRVIGVEVAAEAIAGARRSAHAAGRVGVEFVVGDATRYARTNTPASRPELVVVNPPRRGIGPELAAWIERSGVPYVVYSSCRAGSMATDLGRMPSYSVSAARLFDMFPQTAHHEVAVLLRRSL